MYAHTHKHLNCHSLCLSVHQPFICLSFFLSVWFSFFMCECPSFYLCLTLDLLCSPSLPHTLLSVHPSIHHQLHYPVQLRPGPNLASRPYLCTVCCTWRLTVMQVLFFTRRLCCCLTFLAVRGALAVDFSHITCQCVILKITSTQTL